MPSKPYFDSLTDIPMEEIERLYKRGSRCAARIGMARQHFARYRHTTAPEAPNGYVYKPYSHHIAICVIQDMALRNYQLLQYIDGHIWHLKFHPDLAPYMSENWNRGILGAAKFCLVKREFSTTKHFLLPVRIPHERALHEAERYDNDVPVLRDRY